MEMAEWLAERAKCPALRAPLATLFGRAITNNGRSMGSTWSDTPIPPLGSWTGSSWQEVARLADLAANREAMGRLLVRRNPAGAQAVRAMSDLLGASEDDFRERAGWEWVLEAAIRRSREQALDVAAPALGAVRLGTPADAALAPAGVTAEWSRPMMIGDVPLRPTAGA